MLSVLSGSCEAVKFSALTETTVNAEKRKRKPVAARTICPVLEGKGAMTSVVWEAGPGKAPSRGVVSDGGSAFSAVAVKAGELVSGISLKGCKLALS